MNTANIILGNAIQNALKDLYGIVVNDVLLQKTRKEFEGDLTLVVFPYVKDSKRSPEKLGEEIGNYIQEKEKQIKSFNVVKGFLNIAMKDEHWLTYFNSVKENAQIGKKKPKSSGKQIMLEYSSPNTNKPLHLGHIRNHLLGYSVAEILRANGDEVIKVSIINDRGIHICKSMIAWQKFGKGETPESSGLKGDHLVGKYYVEFDKAYKAEVKALMESGQSKEEAEKNSALMKETQEMLKKWEEGDTAVIELWKKMNAWVYAGFQVTYDTLGIDFDKIYYESNTYLLGKEHVQEGLDKGVFYKKENGNVAIDLTADGLDEKVVLRGDGTSIYITQDIGTAIERFREFPKLNQLIYTVGNEQDYHFKALFKILEKLGYDWAKELYHLSYGMVELPEGKMKSREGTVVDADDLLQEMFDTAAATTKELGKVDDFTESELQSLYRTIGLGALKYFMLKVDPKKKMLFDPKESIDFNGHTGPFIQYTHARICSVLRKADIAYDQNVNGLQLNALERELIQWIYGFEDAVKEAGKLHNPSVVANYIYELVKCFNRFFHDHSILKEENKEIKVFRLQLAKSCGRVIANGMEMLGIKVPERM